MILPGFSVCSHPSKPTFFLSPLLNMTNRLWQASYGRPAQSKFLHQASSCVREEFDFIPQNMLKLSCISIDHTLISMFPSRKSFWGRPIEQLMSPLKFQVPF